jgi:putative flippase GtrA
LTATGVEKDVTKLENKYPVIRTFRFAVAGALGFGVTEVVLTLGLLLLYGRLSVPHASFSSLELLSLDVLSLVIGVSASFFVNERITINIQKMSAKDSVNRLRRFVKFQAVSGVGNTGIVIVQLLLLTSMAISPLVGTVVGAVVTYPIVYFISIKYVWKGHQVK